MPSNYHSIECYLNTASITPPVPQPHLWAKSHLSLRTQFLCGIFPGIRSQEDTHRYSSLNKSSNRLYVSFLQGLLHYIIISNLYTYLLHSKILAAQKDPFNPNALKQTIYKNEQIKLCPSDQSLGLLSPKSFQLFHR